MKNQKITAFLLIIAVLVFASLLVIDHYDTIRESEELKRQSQESNNNLDQLLEEQIKIENELKSFDINDIGDAGKGYSSYLYLVTEPDYQVMTSVEPSLTSNGAIGHLCVSAKEFPDDIGNASRWQAGLLIMQGWDTVIEVDADTDIDDLISSMEYIELPFPSAAYIPDSSCFETCLPKLKEKSIFTVFVNKLPESGLYDGFTFIPIVGISDTDITAKSAGYAEEGRPFAFAIGFTDQEETFSYPSMDGALTLASALEEQYVISLVSIQEAKELTDKHNSEILDALKSNEVHREELLARLEEIKKEIMSNT